MQRRLGGTSGLLKDGNVCVVQVVVVKLVILVKRLAEQLCDRL